MPGTPKTKRAMSTAMAVPAIAATLPKPARRHHRWVTGAKATRPMYTEINHNGTVAAIDPARTTSAGINGRMTTISTVHTTSSGITGVYRRRTLVVIHARRSCSPSSTLRKARALA